MTIDAMTTFYLFFTSPGAVPRVEMKILQLMTIDAKTTFYLVFASPGAAILSFLSAHDAAVRLGGGGTPARRQPIQHSNIKGFHHSGKKLAC
jgi:hypothetical protein